MNAVIMVKQDGFPQVFRDEHGNQWSVVCDDACGHFAVDLLSDEKEPIGCGTAHKNADGTYTIVEANYGDNHTDPSTWGVNNDGEMTATRSGWQLN